MARPAAVLGAVAGLAVVVLLIWRVPPLLYQYVPDAKDRAGAEATTRTGLLAGLVGLAALGTLILNSQTYRVTARTFELAEQGHITERYTAAITQLGDEKLEVRVGGIYALERLAVDSERDHPTIVEVLSALVRERSRLPRETMESQIEPLTDVQTAATVLGRLPDREGIGRGDLAAAMLSGVNLEYANLTGVNLARADLSGAHLRSINLATAKLTGTTLVGADLGLAVLTSANLVEARLEDVHLGMANVIGAELSRASLAKSNLEFAKFTGAGLYGADLTDANLTWTYFDETNLEEALLTNAQMRNMTLVAARLVNANLAGADLSRARLTNAFLGGAYMTGARLGEANLSGTRGLTQAQVDSARGDPKTRLPDDLRRPASWLHGLS